MALALCDLQGLATFPERRELHYKGGQGLPALFLHIAESVPLAVNLPVVTYVQIAFPVWMRHFRELRANFTVRSLQCR